MVEQPLAFAEIPRLLTEKECADLVQRIDREVKDTYDDGDDYHRKSVWDQDLAELCRARLLSSASGGLLGPDANFRLHKWFLTRYPAGGSLGPHVDGTVESEGWRSVASLLVYLNTGFSGGRTVFLDGSGFACVPAAGKALLLRQDVLHCAEAVHAGTKYLLRTDVMRQVPEVPR